MKNDSATEVFDTLSLASSAEWLTRGACHEEVTERCLHEIIGADIFVDFIVVVHVVKQCSHLDQFRSCFSELKSIGIHSNP